MKFGWGIIVSSLSPLLNMKVSDLIHSIWWPPVFWTWYFLSVKVHSFHSNRLGLSVPPKSDVDSVRVLWTIPQTDEVTFIMIFKFRTVIRVNPVWLIIHLSYFSDLLFVSENFHHKETRAKSSGLFTLISDMISEKLCVKAPDRCYSLFLGKNVILLACLFDLFAKFEYPKSD